METNRLDLRTPEVVSSTPRDPVAAPADGTEEPPVAATSRPETEDTAQVEGTSYSDTPTGGSTARSYTSSKPPLTGGTRGSTVQSGNCDLHSHCSGVLPASQIFCLLQGGSRPSRPSHNGSEPETTRSRLSSARRAAQIEGFDDDFAVGSCLKPDHDLRLYPI